MGNLKQIEKKLLEVTLNQYLNTNFIYEVLEKKGGDFLEPFLNELIIQLEKKTLDDGCFWEEMCHTMSNGPRIDQELFDKELELIIKQRVSKYPKLVQYAIWLKSDFNLDAISHENSALVLDYNINEVIRYMCDKLYSRADDWNCIKQDFCSSKLITLEFTFIH